MRTFFLAVTALIVSGATWLLSVWLTGENDPQSTRSYWYLVYPLLAVLAGVFAFGAGRLIAYWPIALLTPHFFFALLTAVGEASLLPLAVGFHVLILVPGFASSALGYTLRKRFA